jgi:hypothetical protein
MLLSAMQPFTSRRSVFVACILALGGMAADPDGGADAASTDDASVDAGATPDASTPADATVASNDASGEAGDDASTASTGPQYVTPDGALPPYNAGNVYDLLCVQDPGVVPFDYSAVQPPYTTQAECKTFANADHAAARSCLCDSCFALQQQCDALPGCKAIQACGFKTGCSDPNSCYLVQGLCATQITEYGTGSVSTALTQLLENCGAAATPTACPKQ